MGCVADDLLIDFALSFSMKLKIHELVLFMRSYFSSFSLRFDSICRPDSVFLCNRIRERVCE